MGFQALELDIHLVLLGELTDAGDQVCGVDHVDGEHAEEVSDDKRKRQILRQPPQRIQNVGVYQKIISRAGRRPDQGELRADKALDVSPLAAVIPQADVHELQGHDTGDVLDDRHAHRHAQKHQQLAARGVDLVGVADIGQHKQDAQAETVQRHIGAHAEARIDPLPLRIGAGDEAPVEQLQHPAQHGADEKQIRQRQKQIHIPSILLLFTFFRVPPPIPHGASARRMSPCPRLRVPA